MKRMKGSYCFLLVMFCSPLMAWAQQPNYAAAEKYDVPNLQKKLGTLTVLPFFFNNDDRFWFSYEDQNGKNYYCIDPVKKEKRVLFNRQIIAAQLQQLRKEPIDTALITYNPPFGISGKQQTVTVSYKGQPYAYNFYTRQLVLLGREEKKSGYPKGLVGTASPDKK